MTPTSSKSRSVGTLSRLCLIIFPESSFPLVLTLCVISPSSLLVLSSLTPSVPTLKVFEMFLNFLTLLVLRPSKTVEGLSFLLYTHLFRMWLVQQRTPKSSDTTPSLTTSTVSYGKTSSITCLKTLRSDPIRNRSLIVPLFDFTGFLREGGTM